MRGCAAYDAPLIHTLQQTVTQGSARQGNSQQTLCNIQQCKHALCCVTLIVCSTFPLEEGSAGAALCDPPAACFCTTEDARILDTSGRRWGLTCSSCPIRLMRSALYLPGVMGLKRPAMTLVRSSAIDLASKGTLHPHQTWSAGCMQALAPACLELAVLAVRML